MRRACSISRCELVARSLTAPQIEGTLANHLEVLTALADVAYDGHNLAAGLFADPLIATEVSSPPEYARTTRSLPTCGFLPAVG